MTLALAALAFLAGMATAYATVRVHDRLRERHKLTEYAEGYLDGRTDEAWENRWSVGVPSTWERN
jgi:hypothetical protein